MPHAMPALMAPEERDRGKARGPRGGRGQRHSGSKTLPCELGLRGLNTCGQKGDDGGGCPGREGSTGKGKDV